MRRSRGGGTIVRTTGGGHVSDYWLAQWLDDQGIENEGDLERRLSAPNALKSIEEHALRFLAPTTPLTGQAPIVAGSTLDLSGHMSCNHPDCLKLQVERLFGRVWHYFDEIVVTGLDVPNPSAGYKPTDEEAADYLETVKNHSQTLLFIRDSGAEDSLIFRPKRHFCVTHGVARIGVSRILEEHDAYVEGLLDGGVLVADPWWAEDHWVVLAAPPGAGYATQIPLGLPESATREELEKAAAEQIFHMEVDSLAGDLEAAREMKSPLAMEYETHEDWLAWTDARPSVAQVAYELALPVLEDVPLRDIVRIRQEEWEHIDAFRQALKAAIRDGLANAGDASAVEIAQTISDDVIQPKLNEITRRMAAAQKAVTAKTAVHAGVGIVVASVGLLTGIPLLIGGGIAAAGFGLPHVDKYIDEKQSIEMEDMYFLWSMESRKH